MADGREAAHPTLREVKQTGLDIACRCGKIGFRASSYTGFHRWRVILAKSVGIDLDAMVDFGGTEPWRTDAPFRELLHHSDCDRNLTRRQCANLANDIAEYETSIVQGLPKVIAEIGIQVDIGLGNMGWDVASDTEYWVSKWQLWKEAIAHATEGCVLRFC